MVLGPTCKISSANLEGLKLSFSGRFASLAWDECPQSTVSNFTLSCSFSTMHDSMDQNDRLSEGTFEELSSLLERKTKEVQIIGDIALRLNDSLEVDTVLADILHLIEKYFDFKYSLILLLDESESTLHVVASNGYEATGIGAEVKVGIGIIGVVAKKKKVIRMGAVNVQRRLVTASHTDTDSDAEHLNTVKLPGLDNPKSHIAIPLLIKGQLVGVLSVEGTDYYMFKEYDEPLIQILANQAAAALQNARLYEAEKRRHLQVKRINEKLSTLNEEQDRTLRLFKQYVPAPVVNKALQAKGEAIFDGEKREIAAMFCDIRDFTPLSEKLRPRQVVFVLNTFYRHMVEVIKNHGGYVTQFVGDEIFATFGAPVACETCERNAVLCAKEMIAGLKSINAELKAKLDVEINVGIGINAGPVIAGNLGSTEKLSYSITGDTVNTAKRIESLTKGTPNSIYISDSVFKQVKQMVSATPLGPIEVKGKMKKIPVYHVH